MTVGRRTAALALLVCGLALAVLAPCASARPASGGVGRFGGAIDWVEWGTNNQVLDVSAPITKTSTTTFSGHQLVVSCTISNFARVGGGAVTLKAYRSGNWSGDALDDLYNIGGTQTSNTLINGLAVSGMDVSFDFACSATLDGSPYALAGLVFADGEQSSGVEYVAGTISTSATWRLIDRFRTSTCTNDSQVTRTVVGSLQTLRLDNPGALCTAGPAGVAFADGATSGRIAVRGGGTSAVALGAVVTFDHGDAPASYGDALHAAPYSFSGGVPATGTSALFAGNTLADTAQPALRLGASVDPEGTVFSATANADDVNPTGAFGPGDDETEAPPATINVDRGAQFTHTVACSGAGVLAGWIDWNANGTFDAGERAGNATCSGASASLTWTVPSDAVPQTRSFMRLRYAASAAEVADPTGLALSGEVEDHAFAITMPPDLTVTKSSSPATVEPGGTVTWTITLRNLGPGPSQGAIVQDTIPAGVTNVSAPGCTIAGATVSCVFGPLNVNQSFPITITAKAPTTTSTCFTNTATITTTLPADRDTTNNSAQATSCTRAPLADVRIAKSAAPTTVLQGNQVTYTLTVSNTGPDPADNVQVLDAPAPGVTPISATPSQGSCATASSCSLGALPANGPPVTVQVVATATALGTQGNTATVSTTTAETESSNNAASATIVVQPQADLRIAKSASQTTLTEGDDFTYTLAVRNDGPSTADDAVVSDSVPAGVSVRSVDTSRGSCSQADPIVCQLGDLAKGATATITVHATADRAGSPVNTAIVSSRTPDPDTTNNQDETRLTTNARADLSITKTASTQTLLLGESFTYTLRVRNDGPSAAVNSVVTDRVPDGLQLEVVSSSKGTCAGAPVVVCQLGTLAKGDTATISLTVSTHRSGTIDNSASVTSETPDPDPDDNVDQARIEVGTRADLAITKAANVKTVTAGDTVVYGVVVTNKGPHDAANVTVTDPVPAGMRVVSAKPSTGSCKVTGGVVVTCALGDLANGASVTIRLEMVAEQAGSTRNVAAVTSPTPDPDPTNNQAETEITAEKADLSITKTAPAKPVALGARVTYTLTVRNAGPSGARGVVVTDPIPEGIQVTKAGAPCTVLDDAVVCPLGDLATGQTATVTVTGRAVRQGRVNNVASVTSKFPSDPDLRNNSDGAGIDVRPGAAKLSLTKRASSPRALVGSRVRYRIVVANEGARSAHDVRVCDDLPAGMSYVDHRGARLRNGQACWTIAALAPHTTCSLTVTARVLAGQSQRLVNVARLDGLNVKPARDTAGVQRVLGERRAGGVTG